MTRPVVLTIAGSDCSGGAGLQADLRMFSHLGTFGTTVVTAVTAQNLRAVSDVHAVPAANVQAQLDAVLAGFTVRAVKTGMLWSTDIVRLVATACRTRGVKYWVVDPVMVATSGARLLHDDAVQAYRDELIPAATVVTPNLNEAAVLLGVKDIERANMRQAALALSAALRTAVLLKGGHLGGAPVDMLATSGVVTMFEHPRLLGVNTHGTGCMLSAALAACLARGLALPDACAKALFVVADALCKPWRLDDDTALAGIEASDVDGALTAAG